MRQLAVLALMMCTSGAASAEQSHWQAEKCRLYEQAWTRALTSLGSDNMNYNFMAANENFIASGCTETVRACPQSVQEQQIADLLTIVMMNEGAASTFLPFSCTSATD